ncbi:MAG: polysaccharide biosynthesis protein [Planctomycetes bacterium]|nr:polysaccharide biosynthesis protein [Planctomycetota bacterium]
MTREPVLIRVDANPQTGYERIARCLILSAALQRRRRTAYFLSNLEPSSLATKIRRQGNEWIATDRLIGDKHDLRQTTQEIRKLKPAAIIVDDASASEDYLAHLSCLGPMLVSLDHTATIRLPSNLIINPLLGPARDSYEFLPGAQLLLGRRYTLVRPEVRRMRPVRSQEPAPLPAINGKPATGQFRALVALGEDDPNLRTLELAKLLLGMPKLGKVDIIVKPFHPDMEKIQALAEANPDRVEIALEPAEIIARLVRCHFAITSGSGWSLELACIGVPQLMILQSEAHWPTAQRLEEEGCATCLGWHENVSASTIRTSVQNLLGDSLERQSMARCARKLIDGRGPDRLVLALELMLRGHRAAADLAEAA